MPPPDLRLDTNQRAVVPLDDPRWVPSPGNEQTKWRPGHTDPSNKVESWDLDGVPWHQADAPDGTHPCTPQTWGWLGILTTVERCACGAMRINQGPWAHRNTRAGVPADPSLPDVYETGWL